MAAQQRSPFLALVILSFLLQIIAIGIMLYGIKTGQQLVTAGIPLLVVGSMLLVVAIAQKKKQK
ncbi:hypothetical protein [Sandarakinorhabdus sp.]|uniref:hypothetical protein n=1 Tax=Sandarakinorhabdus sp. TaxID=1916663 RepID=UPI00286E99E7|nr:hypothetical protein [Sandarakinorhabdus sp.]